MGVREATREIKRELTERIDSLDPALTKRRKALVSALRRKDPYEARKLDNKLRQNTLLLHAIRTGAMLFRIRGAV